MLLFHTVFFLFENNSVRFFTWIMAVDILSLNYFGVVLRFSFLFLLFHSMNHKSCGKNTHTHTVFSSVLPPHDVETHASMGTWQANETDIYPFWLCIQIWYLFFFLLLCFPSFVFCKFRIPFFRGASSFYLNMLWLKSFNSIEYFIKFNYCINIYMNNKKYVDDKLGWCMLNHHISHSFSFHFHGFYFVDFIEFVL